MNHKQAALIFDLTARRIICREEAPPRRAAADGESGSQTHRKRRRERKTSHDHGGGASASGGAGDGGGGFRLIMGGVTNNRRANRASGITKLTNLPTEEKQSKKTQQEFQIRCYNCSRDNKQLFVSNAVVRRHLLLESKREDERSKLFVPRFLAQPPSEAILSNFIPS